MNANGSDYRGGAQRNQVAVRPIKDLLNDDYVKVKFQEILGSKAPAFLASVLTATNTNGMLATCNPKTILSAAMVAASLDLPIDGNLGFAAIVPYNDKNRGPVAQFQIMYKGFIQLAQRTGQYQTMNVTEVYADELKKHDPITGEVVIEYVPGGDRENDRMEKIVGYAAYFRLINGFEKTEYWPISKLEAHGKKYSKSYGGKNSQYSLWATNKPAMFSKTVLKALISKWGIMSTSMMNAVVADQAVVKSMENGISPENMDYADNPEEDSRDVTPTEPEAHTTEPKPAKAKDKPVRPEMTDEEAAAELAGMDSEPEFPEPPDPSDGPDLF